MVILPRPGAGRRLRRVYLPQRLSTAGLSRRLVDDYAYYIALRDGSPALPAINLFRPWLKRMASSTIPLAQASPAAKP